MHMHKGVKSDPSLSSACSYQRPYQSTNKGDLRDLKTRAHQEENTRIFPLALSHFAKGASTLNHRQRASKPPQSRDVTYADS